MGAKDNGTCNSLQPTQTAAIEVPASTLQPSKTQPTLVFIDLLLRCNKGAHWFIKFSFFFHSHANVATFKVKCLQKFSERPGNKCNQRLWDGCYEIFQINTDNRTWARMKTHPLIKPDPHDPTGGAWLRRWKRNNHRQYPVNITCRQPILLSQTLYDHSMTTFQ